MSRHSKGIRLWLEPEERSKDGKLIHRAAWVIRTARVKCARVALEKTAKVLSARSPNTSLPDTKFRESVDVTPLKSRSSTC